MVFLYIFSLLILILEKGFLISFFPSGIIPQLFMIFTVFALNYESRNLENKERDWNQFLVWFFINSLLYDILSASLLGYASSIFFLNLLLVYLLNKLFPHNLKYLLFLIEIIVSSLVFNLGSNLLSKILGISENPFINFANLFKILSLNLLTGLILYPFFLMIFRTIFKREDKQLNLF